MDLPLGTLRDVIRWVLARPRLSVRIVRDATTGDEPELQFEVEDRSGNVTSLHPPIACKFYYLSKGRITKGRNRYFVRDVQRRLEPFQPVMLRATPEFEYTHYGFSWYRTLRFRPAAGWATRVRIQNAHLEAVSLPRFLWELVRFRLTGWVPSEEHSSLDDWERLRRSQGPH